VAGQEPAREEDRVERRAAAGLLLLGERLAQLLRRDQSAAQREVPDRETQGVACGIRLLAHLGAHNNRTGPTNGGELCRTVLQKRLNPFPPSQFHAPALWRGVSACTINRADDLREKIHFLSRKFARSVMICSQLGSLARLMETASG